MTAFLFLVKSAGARLQEFEVTVVFPLRCHFRVDVLELTVKAEPFQFVGLKVKTGGHTLEDRWSCGLC